MTQPVFAVQTALTTALRADTTLMNALQQPDGSPGLYSFVNPSAHVPYATFGNISNVRWDVMRMPGRMQLWDFTLWSQQPGDSENAGIASMINDILSIESLAENHQNLSVDGWNVVYVREEDSRPVPDAEGSFRKWLATYRILIQRQQT